MSDSKLVSFKKLCYGAQFKYSADESAVWVKIGHNTVAGWNPKYVSDSWIGQPICAFAEGDQLDTDVFLVTPAPAEDVRAVVEAPVYLQHMAVAENGVLRWMSGRKMQDCELYALPGGGAIRDELYRHPQRQVVLPKFNDWYAKNVGVLGTDQAKHDESVWRACLVAVEELKKC